MMDQITSAQEYQQQWKQAQENPKSYWASVAENLEWFQKWDEVQRGDFNDLNVEWFVGAKTNITTNCLDRHLESRADKTALIFAPNDPSEQPQYLSYRQLFKRVSQMANLLKDKGIKRGDVVCLYMGMTPELLISVLACARIGAIHSVVFGGFSAKALADRINDGKAKMVLTHDGGLRGDKVIALKNIVDQALENCPSVASVLVFKRANNDISMKAGRDHLADDLLKEMSDDCPAEQMNAEDPLFILYTSGSTGKPKGLLHTTAGYMTYAFHTFRNVFQMQEQDIYWCSADIGWITGHTYLTYGPLLNGATTLMFEGVPTWPDASRFWQVIDQHRVTHFYTAPTAIRALEAFGVDFVRSADLRSLKVLGSVGEPINQEAWEWFYKEVGKEKCPIVDTWWQTETGGIMISNLAGVTEGKACHATWPLPGIEPVIVDEKGVEQSDLCASGHLCIKRPWPGMARTVYGDHQRYRQTYFSHYPGKYFTGDGALRDQEGRYRITGRVDDVINVSGHRIGTAEVENAIDEHPLVFESAVVGFPHEIKGQGIYAYLICEKNNKSEEEIKKEVDELIKEIIGPIAKTDAIQVVSGLPKTRSGKIMRRILRKVAEGELEQIGDTSTLLNPEIVDELIANKKS